MSPKPCIGVWHDALIWYFLGRGLEPVIGVLYVLIAHVACSLLLCSNRSGWQDRKYKGKRPCAGLSFHMVFIPCPCLNRRQASLLLTLHARRASLTCVICRALFVCSVIYVPHTCVKKVFYSSCSNLCSHAWLTRNLPICTEQAGSRWRGS